MRSLFVYCFYAYLFCSTTIGMSQDSREAEIRRLEKIEREAVLASDSATLFDKIWSPLW